MRLAPAEQYALASTQARPWQDPCKTPGAPLEQNLYSYLRLRSFSRLRPPKYNPWSLVSIGSSNFELPKRQKKKVELSNFHIVEF